MMFPPSIVIQGISVLFVCLELKRACIIGKKSLDCNLRHFLLKCVLLSPVELYDGLVLHVAGSAGVGAQGQGGHSMQGSSQTHATAPDMRHQAHSETGRWGET